MLAGRCIAQRPRKATALHALPPRRYAPARPDEELAKSMCGIAGWFRRQGRLVLGSVVSAQCDAIRHRGPDDSGVLSEGDFGFGMRRLSIIDVAGGHQPMTSPDGRYSIVFNGEIYNHLDVRRELPDYPFKSHSDTETILAAFARWGNEAWGRLEGMFAVADWDRETRTLTLAS